MSHMLPPDNENDYSTPSNSSVEPKVNHSPMAQLFTRLVILMGIIILIVLLKGFFFSDKKVGAGSPYDNNGQGQLGNGSSLGGAGGGALVDEDGDEIPTPESLSRQIKGGQGMKVFISSPNGSGEMRELTPEQQKAVDEYLDKAMKQQGSRAVGKPVGGDNTEATPVGGAGGGQ